jgi:hypothetical protein
MDQREIMLDARTNAFMRVIQIGGPVLRILAPAS